MSVVAPLQIHCPHCDSTFEVDAYASLHVRRAPEVREAILGGAFQHQPCPECGGHVTIEQPMLYTDFQRDQLYALVPASALPLRRALAEHLTEVFRHNLEVAAPPIVKAWAPRFQRRVVFGLPHLREKILAAEHGIDDRALEALKVWLLRDSAPRLLDWRSDVVLTEVGDDSLTLAMHGPPADDGTEVAFVRSVGRDNLTQAARSAASLEGLQGLVVDWRALFAPHRIPSVPFEHALPRGVAYETAS